MAVSDGYKQYVCDRCGKLAYIKQDSAEAQSWGSVQRVSVDKASADNPVTRYTMCYACRTAYTTFDRPQDDEFASWMGQPARDQAAEQAEADAQAKAKKEAEKAAHDKEIADAEARGRAAQKAEDEKNMIPVPTVPGTGSDTGSGTTGDGTTTPETGSGDTKED